ncbi:AraC family transcriptional regulator [Bradyrhizobium sp. NP1]|uniref:AraC family transcriptional regulator n=1 Tax=Bradyrhizobium sp. NP1 TaxID=3049772 RepID=UPI0025A59347|nr:AraC family transcriptional regulator [Bradyrhizobium sp. NP1]WJR77329.1 AraC family transcriptional regulator [Bradyrhizobium sp. NP1]
MNPTTSDGEPFRFSTDDAPPQERVALLREIVGRIYLRLDPAPIGDGPVRTIVEQHPWAAATLIFCKTNPLAYLRSPELVRDGDGDFRFVARVEGTRYHYAGGGGEETMNPDDAALLFNGAASTIQVPNPASLTAVRIRRSDLAMAVKNLDERPIRRAAGGAASLTLLNGYIATLRSHRPSTDPILAHRVGRHLIDLVALVLGPTEETRQRAAGGATRAARLATIRADVLANLSEFNLSAKTIGRRHGVSDRYIHMLFEETGQTFSRFVEAERLQRAFAMLVDPDNATKRISEIAADVGFAELSTFGHAFRRRFDDTPTGVRARHAAGLPASPPGDAAAPRE